MDVETIKRVIRDQEEETKFKLSNERIINREYLTEIKRHMKYPNAVVISGVRRSGKSTSAILLADNKSYGRLNFDDPSLDGIEARDLVNVTEAIYQLYGDVDCIILDEIQNVKGWELYVSRLREIKRLIITGSNSELMSEELASRLTGRYIKFVAFPFSFHEFLDYYDIKTDIYSTEGIAKVKGLFEQYVALGGFPEALKSKERYLIQVYDDIITKDIARRFNIKHRETFRELAKYLVSNVSRITNYSKLRDTFGIKSVNTVKDYISFMEMAFLIFKVDKYSSKFRHQISSGKKVYCIDTGMSNSIGFRVSEDRGRFLENVVAIELLRRKNYWDPLLEIYYWQDYKQNEVDFVLKRKNSISELIQVAYRVDTYDTKEREVKALLNAAKELKCENLLILTNDYEGHETIEKKEIKFMPVWKWLLLSRMPSDKS